MSLLSRLFPGYETYDEYKARRVREAEERWRVRNAEKKAEGCPCGAEATVVEYDHSNVGSVPVETWTCEAHTGVASWSGTRGAMRPYWARSQPCAAHTWAICGGELSQNGGAPYQWHCPARYPAEPVPDTP